MDRSIALHVTCSKVTVHSRIESNSMYFDTKWLQLNQSIHTWWRYYLLLDTDNSFETSDFLNIG